jgi:Uma2 family endonuclease
MTPPSAIHGALAARLAILFGRELSRRGEVALRAGIVPASPHAYYQADLTVTCAPVTGQPFVGAPRVIAEVLSPSTAATDYLRKLPDYRSIPSVRDILLVSSTEPRIEHWRREADGWKVQDFRGEGRVRLRAFEVTIALAGLYRDLLPAEEAQQAAG